MVILILSKDGSTHQVEHAPQRPKINIEHPHSYSVHQIAFSLPKLSSVTLGRIPSSLPSWPEIQRFQVFCLKLHPGERRRDKVKNCQFHGYLCHVILEFNKSGNSSPPNESPPRALPCLSKQKHGLSASFCWQKSCHCQKKIQGLQIGIISGRLSI